MVHPGPVGIVRVGHPRIVLRAVLALLAGNALLALDVAPQVVRGVVALQRGFLVVGEPDELLPVRVVGDAIALCVVRIANPSVQRLAVLARLARHALRTVRPVLRHQHVLGGVLLAGEDVSVGLSAVLRLEQPVAALVGNRPQRGIVRSVLADALPGRTAHPHDSHIGHEQPGVPAAQVDQRRARLSLRARLAFYLAPLVVGGYIALHGCQLVVGQADILLPGRVVGDAVALSVVRVADPRVMGDAVRTLVAGHALRALRAPFPGFALRTLLTLLSLLTLLALGALLALVALLHLQQPVRVALGGFHVRSVLGHAQPDAAVVAHPVIEVVMSGGPRAPIVGRAYRCAVWLHLEYLPSEIHRVQVGGIAFQRHSVDVQVAEVAVLLRDVLRTDFPRVLLPELSGVGAGLVDGGLAGRVGEVAVAGEVHLRLGMDGVAGSQRIGERAVVAAGHARDAEIGGGEPGEGEVALPVVRVLRGVQCRVLEMIDAQRDVVQGHRAQLAVLQLQGAGAGGERAPLRIGVRRAGQDDAGTRHAPLDAEEHFHAVAADFRHLQPFPKPQAAHLAVAFLVNLGPEPGESPGKPVFADDDAVQEGHQEGHRLRMRLREEFQAGAEGGIHVVVTGCLRVRGLDDVDDGLFRLPGQFIVQAAQLVFQRLLPSRSYLVGAGDGGLAEVVQLPDHLGDAGVLVAAGEIFFTQQPHVPAHLQRGAVGFDVVAVGGAVVFFRVEAVGGQEIIHGLGVGLLCRVDVLLRQGEVPGNVGVARLGDNLPAGQLGAVVRVDVDDFPLPRVLVPVGLEGTLAVAAPDQLAGLEGEHLHVVGNLVVRGVEVHPAVLYIIYGVVAAFLVGLLFGADGSDGAHILRVYAREGGFLVTVLDAVEVRVLVHIRRPGRKLEAGVAVLARIDVAGGTEGKQAGEETHLAILLLRQAGQALQVAQADPVAALGLAEVDDVAVRPHFRVERGGDAVAAEGRVPAVDILVFNGLVVPRDDGADAPHVLPGDAVHIVHPQLEVGARVAVVRKFRGDFPVRLKEEKRVFRIVDGGVKLHVVLVGLRVLLPGAVPGTDLVPDAVHHRIIVHVQRDEGRIGEGGGHAVFAHHLFRHRGRGVGAGRQFQAPCAVVYLQ